MKNEVEDVLDKLEKLHAQFDELISIAESTSNDKSSIKQKYGALKVKLKNDQKMSLIDKHFNSATEAEQIFYFPAVCAAANALKIPIGGKVTDEFISYLYDAQDQINYYLHNLKRA